MLCVDDLVTMCIHVAQGKRVIRGECLLCRV